MTGHSLRRLVVTGASSGIGRAVALLAATQGWDVLATVRADGDRDPLEKRGIRTALLELRDAESIGRFAEAAERWCGGGLEALVNNAGVALAGPVEELRLDEIREQFEVNVFGHVDLTQRLLPALRRNAGRVVFVSTDRVERPVPLYGAYVASKRALHGFAEALAGEVRPFGVAVAILELGSFESSIREAIRPRFESLQASPSIYAELAREVGARLGTPPLGPPEDAAGAVLSLLSGDPPPLITVFGP
jgi:NAD(P)-dependent dehydrogenase (short-subunit alcohol dehydrogenase family)